MKRNSLLFVTALTVGLTGMMLLNVEGSPVTHRATASRATAAHPVNPCQDPAARAWLHVQPHHWRDCMLQH